MALASTSPARSDSVRTCIGCRARAARRDLLRVTVGTDALGHRVAEPDPGRAAAGRGANLHPTATCLALAVRRKAFGRALRVSAGINTDALESWVANASGDWAARSVAAMPPAPGTATPDAGAARITTAKIDTDTD